VPAGLPDAKRKEKIQETGDTDEPFSETEACNRGNG